MTSARNGAGDAVRASGPDARTEPLFHVVLHEPEIPNNTGNIGRTCVATGCALHLIHPLGFEVSEKACRRAGLDYWPRLDVHHYLSWHHYLGVSGVTPNRLWLLSTKAATCVFDAPLRLGDHLVFGKETAGLPADVLAANPERVIHLPMMPDERSLNLATAVCAVVYEGIRQALAQHELTVDVCGRIAGRARTGCTPRP